MFRVEGQMLECVVLGLGFRVSRLHFCMHV